MESFNIPCKKKRKTQKKSTKSLVLLLLLRTDVKNTKQKYRECIFSKHQIAVLQGYLNIKRKGRVKQKCRNPRIYPGLPYFQRCNR